MPTWFTTSARSIPVGTIIVVYPFASPTDTSGMLWQAMADLTFRMPGGYAVFPTAAGTATFDSAPSPLQMILSECTSGAEPQVSSSTIRSELRSWNVSVVVVAVSAPGAACATRLFDNAYGPPKSSGGVRLWTEL